MTDYTENAKMYLTVLKNISKGTPVQAEAEILLSDFEKSNKKTISTFVAGIKKYRLQRRNFNLTFYNYESI